MMFIAWLRNVPQRDRLRRIEFCRLARKELRKVCPLFRKTNSGGAGREVDGRLEEFLVGTSLGGNDGAGKPGETERGAERSTASYNRNERNGG